MFIDNIRAQVCDMEYNDVPIIYPNMTIGQAWDVMVKTHHRMIPVVDRETETFIGVISMGDITRVNMQIEDCSLLSQYRPSIENLVTTLQAVTIVGEYENHKNTIVEGRVIVAMSAHDIVNEKPQKEDVIITRPSERCVKTAVGTGAKYIFLIGECKEGVKKHFESLDNDRILLCIKHDVFAAVKLITQSIPISSVMSAKNLVYFYESDLFTEVQSTLISSRYRSFPILDDDNKVIGSLSRRHLLDIHKKIVILVDHNEKGQSVKGLEEAEVIEIVDHHRV
jgi:manganese-dependent inorganic pyrophosphatase